MDEVDEAIAALRREAYDRADGILRALGGAKPGTAPRVRALWALTQVMLRKFGDGADALLDIAGRGPNRSQSVHQRLQLWVGPLDELLCAKAAQEVRLRVGDYFLREEKAEEAALWLKEARSVDGNDPLAIYLEANCRFALYGERQAVREMESILERAADQKERAYFVGGGIAALWFRLGIAHDRMKNLDTAARYLATAVTLTSDNDAQRLLLGDVLIRLERFDEAIAQLEAIPKIRRQLPLCRTALRHRPVPHGSDRRGPESVAGSGRPRPARRGHLSRARPHLSRHRQCREGGAGAGAGVSHRCRHAWSQIGDPDPGARPRPAHGRRCRHAADHLDRRAQRIRAAPGRSRAWPSGRA